jgi:hypothetical protein
VRREYRTIRVVALTSSNPHIPSGYAQVWLARVPSGWPNLRGAAYTAYTIGLPGRRYSLTVGHWRDRQKNTGRAATRENGDAPKE